MLSRKLIWIGNFVLALAGLLIFFFPGNSHPANSAPISFESAPYSDPGPYGVGIAEQVVGHETKLGLTLWYPARVRRGNQEPITYQYEMKMGKPVGTAAIASYQGTAVRGAAPDPIRGPFPLVILSPGFSIGSTSYGWLAEHLASYGFVVISPDHAEYLDPENQLWRGTVNRPQDIHAVLAHVEDNLQRDDMYQGIIDITSVAVIGHSYGGYTALAAAGARIDTDSFQTTCQETLNTDQPGAWLCEMLLPHIVDMAELAGLDAVPKGLWPGWEVESVKAIVTIAGDAFFFGQPGLSQISIPVLAIGGTADEDSPFSWGTHPSFKYSAGPRKAEVALIDAEHMVFTGPCESVRWYLSFLSGEFCSDTSWDRSYAHAVTRHFTTAFLLAELTGDQKAAGFLVPDTVGFQNIQFTAEGY